MIGGIAMAQVNVRIDGTNRIVYTVEDDILKIVQCGSHYRDK